MDRRKFLMAAGATPAVIAGLPNPAWALGTQPFLDQEKLDNRNSNRSTVACQNGIVCASQPLAAMAGIDILKAGGNCIDAGASMPQSAQTPFWDLWNQIPTAWAGICLQSSGPNKIKDYTGSMQVAAHPMRGISMKLPAAD